eukprot:scaffold45999_cov37-Prasinocladus_malaysianus.AAC.2
MAKMDSSMQHSQGHDQHGQEDMMYADLKRFLHKANVAERWLHTLRQQDVTLTVLQAMVQNASDNSKPAITQYLQDKLSLSIGAAFQIVNAMCANDNKLAEE